MTKRVVVLVDKAPGYAERLMRSSRARKQIEQAIKMLATDQVQAFMDSHPFFAYASADGPIELGSPRVDPESGDPQVFVRQTRYFANGRRAHATASMDAEMFTEHPLGIRPEFVALVRGALLDRFMALDEPAVIPEAEPPAFA